MSRTALSNKVALASTGDKLKHWTQAIRDLYAELLELEESVVPEYHASPTDQYGLGDTFRYGHLKLLDKILSQFQQNEDGTWWTQSDMPIRSGYRWNAVTYSTGLFVAVGSHGRIVTSVDGKHWDAVHWTTTPQAIANYEFFDVKRCGNIFVAVGSFNSFVYSYDGTYWHVPMHVGASYTQAGVLVNHADDLTQRPEEWTSDDAWKGVAYDEQTGIIMLCGTQARTMECRYSAATAVSSVVFEMPVFHVDASLVHTHEYRTISAKKLPDRTRTSFVAAGNWNEVLQFYAGWEDGRIHWAHEGEVNPASPMVIEDAVHSISGGTISSETGWNCSAVQRTPAGEDVFVLVGTSGQSVISLTGEEDSWSVPLYEDQTIKTDFRCNAVGTNLSVTAGIWTEAAAPNITMFNDSVYVDPADVEYGNSAPVIQHFTTAVDEASWYGAAYGKGVFVLAGDSNRLYWSEEAEEDTTGCALSIQFYKNYIMALEERIRELENGLFKDDLTYVELRNTVKAFNWSDNNVQMFRTAGDVVLRFAEAPQSIYKEMTIYLEALEDTNLSLGGSAEWENDLLSPEWGRTGSHMCLRAIFIGSRVIVQIIDNDQLADNLMDLTGG